MVPDVVVLFFALGLVARLAGSELKVPQALYETLSIYLLLAIGLKGGVEISRQDAAALAPQIAACVALGLAIPFVLVPVLRRLGFSGVDSASLAAHYGSVSVVTFAVATSWLKQAGIPYESHAALWVAVMEAPALLTAIFLARRQGSGPTDWKRLAQDVLAGPSVMLLTGGLLIGAFMGAAGTAPLNPVFVDPFKGVLALFMLELGLVAGERIGQVRQFGVRLLAFGVLAPVALAVPGALVGAWLGLSVGGIAILATLAASASYIAAPTAMRIAVPQANAALSVAASLGVTFPFNVLVGIPLYAALAKQLG
jgi:hypothetical protein